MEETKVSDGQDETQIDLLKAKFMVNYARYDANLSKIKTLLGFKTKRKRKALKDLQAENKRPTSAVSKIGPGLAGVYSDAALVIMTSSQNPNKRIKFDDIYPTNLSPLQFDVTGSDVAYLEADVTFRYRSFTVVNV